MKVFKWELSLMGRKEAEHCEDQLRSTKRLQSQVLVLQAGAAGSGAASSAGAARTMTASVQA